MTKIIYVDGLEVALTRKRVRNMNMRIKDPDGSIAVSVPYLTPESEVKRFIRSRRSWIDKSRAAIIERAAAYPEPETRAEKEARRRDLKRRIAERLPYIEEVTGLRCSGWTVRDMKSRWGSCQTKTRVVTLNSRLALYPEDWIEHVIVHELCHLLVPNHSAAFHDLMTAHLPSWRERQKRTNTMDVRPLPPET